MPTIPRILITYTIALFLFILFSIFPNIQSQAQPGGGGENPPTTDVPIDGGLSILMAAGIAFGFKKKYGEINREKHQNSGLK